MAASTCTKLFQPRILRCKSQIMWQSFRFLRKPVPPLNVRRPESKMRSVIDFLKEHPDYNGNKPIAQHPMEYLTMADVMEELNAKDPELDSTVNIGFTTEKQSKRTCNKLEHERRIYLRNLKNDRDLEKAARSQTLKISVDEVRQEWQRTNGPQQMAVAAEHYGIFRDLFGFGHFVPRVQLNVAYDFDEKYVNPVYRGNHVTPTEASSVPQVQFESSPDSLWTLVLTNPDGHLQDNSAEYLHWFIGNIPGSDLTKGDLVCDYLRPLPPKGTGFHRFVFILYKQDQKIDYSELKREAPCLRLKDRTFKTLDFYRDRQDILTPAGLAFFQTEYDDSLRDFFHNVLQMREPVFEYDFPKPYIRPQKAIPHRQPFNVYLEKYRDPQDVGKEILLKRIKNINPFEPEPPRPAHPNIFHIPQRVPSWLRTEMYKERMRIGKYRGLDVEIFKPERPLKYNPKPVKFTDPVVKRYNQ